MKEIRLLRSDEIEVRVKQVFAKDEKGNGSEGAIALLYKQSRTDMNILDETFGQMNWTDDYRDIDGVLYCGIGAREEAGQDFVWKWSNGIESRKDDEGNEVKGEASDALKRAGFLWGIGRELYSAPFIWLDVKTKRDKGFPVLADKKARFYVDCIEYKDKKISYLVIKNQNGEQVFAWYDDTPKPKTGDDAPYHKDIAGIKKTVLGKEGLPWEDELPAKKPLQQPGGMVDDAMINDIWSSAAEKGYSDEDVQKVIVKIFQKEYVEDLTVDEGNTLLKRIKGA